MTVRRKISLLFVLTVSVEKTTTKMAEFALRF